MAGTKAGAEKAKKTLIDRYGKDYFKKTGKLGGMQTYKSGKLYKIGFASDIERARVAGAKGGRISRKGKKNVKHT